MVNGEREFMILDGGFSFDYLVLDEVHTLNGPEGDALQRIIRATRCPVLALSATIGNASQLQAWFQQVRDEHLAIIEKPPSPVNMVEHFARFINLQRYVLKETVIGGEQSYTLKKLHPVAAMTRSMLCEQKDLISALSMTPVDLMNLWCKMEKFFPDSVSSKDSPGKFFFPEKVIAASSEARILLFARNVTAANSNTASNAIDVIANSTIFFHRSPRTSTGG